MKRLALILTQAAVAGSLAVSALAVTAGTAAAWDRRVVRCDRDGDFCVVYRCDDGFCRRVGAFHRDRDDRWLRGYRFARRERWEDGGYAWYGDRHVRCDRDGDRCRVVR